MPCMKIRIAIADDHLMVINGIQKMLSEFTGFVITDTWMNGEELIEGLEQNVPDVLLLDIQMPGKKGDKLLPLILKKHPDMKVLVLTNFDSLFYVRTMMQHGAKGFLLKSTDPGMLTDAIRAVYEGREYIEPELEIQLKEKNIRTNRMSVTMPAVSTREREVLQLIADGNTTQEIAESLFLSFTTVENYRFNLLSKFGVKNTATLVKKAVQLGMVT